MSPSPPSIRYSPLFMNFQETPPFISCPPFLQISCRNTVNKWLMYKEIWCVAPKNFQFWTWKCSKTAQKVRFLDLRRGFLCLIGEQTNMKIWIIIYSDIRIYSGKISSPPLLTTVPPLLRSPPFLIFFTNSPLLKSDWFESAPLNLGGGANYGYLTGKRDNGTGKKLGPKFGPFM